MSSVIKAANPTIMERWNDQRSHLKIKLESLTPLKMIDHIGGIILAC